MWERRKNKDRFWGYDVAVIGPAGALRDKLELEIHFATVSGVRILRYDSAKGCSWQDLCRCAALYIILDSREEIDAVHSLRPGEEEVWPLVMITGNRDYGVDAFALGACHCLMPPLEREAVREGFRRCLEKKETHVVRVTVGRKRRITAIERWMFSLQRRFRSLRKRQNASRPAATEQRLARKTNRGERGRRHSAKRPMAIPAGGRRAHDGYIRWVRRKSW